MNLLAKAVELKVAQEAAKPVEKVSLLARIKAYFRKRAGKKAYEALKQAKREEKAQLALTNAERADLLDKESDELIMQSIGVKDKAKVDELIDLATAKSIEAASLRVAF